MSNTLTYQFKVELRLAKREDFLAGKDVKHGTVYYLRSAYTQKFEGPYILWPESDLKTFGEYLKSQMVYVEKENVSA